MSGDNIYKAAIYCRLSKDDEQDGDSVSIETQKMMLSRFCEDHGFEIFDIYVDDGYSGSNFNRPSFKRLILELEEGKFNVVVTKDLSRLGRDYIQTGYYIDIYFTSKRVRYIAVNDGIDTNNENNDIAPFKNILNDMYARDISRKIKTAKHQRAQNGLHISAQTPFGYKVNPYNRNQLIIDEEAAPAVRRIFTLAGEGKSFSEISRILEAERYICPSVHKVMTGDTRFLKYTATKTEVCKWSYQTVRSIVINPVYVGDMVNHKYEVANYKTKQRVRVPVEEQIIVPNMHEAIIERDLFNKINNGRNRRRANHKLENIFKGILFCKECGTEMQLISAPRKKSDMPLFRCPLHAKDKALCTHYHYIYYDELVSEIKKQLHAIIAKYIDSNEYILLCELIFNDIYSRVLEKNKRVLQGELNSVNKQIKEYYRSSVKASDEKISEQKPDNLLEKQKALINEIGKISFETPSYENKVLIVNKIAEDAKKYLYKTVTCEKNFNRLIKKIELGHIEKTTSGNYQRITVQYAF